MAKKDPALSRSNDFDDDFLSELDSLGNDLEGFSVDTKEIDSESDRTPAGKVRAVTKGLSHVGKSAMGGAATAIAMRLKHDMPEVTRMVGDTIGVVSDVKRLKDDVAKDIRPTINQTKVLTRQMMKYASDVIPTGVFNKLMEKLDVPEEDRDKRPSVEDSRQTSQDHALSRIFKVQMKERMVDRQQEEISRLIDQRLQASRHGEITGMVSDIRNQALFQTNFYRSTMTAYMRKDLELKYRHMYLAEDTLETLRITSQMLEKRLDTIRHNTALPDSQKIHLTEILANNTKEKLLGGIQSTLSNYVTGMFGRIKENYIEPAKDMIGGSNDMLQGMLSMLEMNEDMGEKFNAKKSLLGGIGSFLGGTAGAIGGRKMLDKLSPEAKKVLTNHAKMGKQGLVLLLEQLRRGELDFEGSDTLSNILDGILPEVDRSGGKFENAVYKDPNAPGAITKRFTTTVEEIIPGYLSMQVALLKEMVTGRKSEELVYDFKSRNFMSSSDFKDEQYQKIYGTEEERGAILKGNADATRKALAPKGRRAQATFEKVAKEVSIFMINLSNAKHWAKINIESIKEVAETGMTEDEFSEIAFRGISNRSEVATALLSLLTNADGSVNEDVKSSMEVRIVRTMEEVSDRHRKAIHDAVFNYGYGRHVNSLIRADKEGDFVVDDGMRLAAFDSIGSDKLADSYGYDLDEYGRKSKDKTALEKLYKAGKESHFIKNTMGAVGKKLDKGMNFLAGKVGKKDEYQQLKVYLASKFEALCAFLSAKKQGIKDFSSDVKKAIIDKAYAWLRKRDSMAPLVSVLFDRDGKLRDNIPPPELANFLARMPKLHRICQRIHKADNPVMFVLDSMLPHSLIIVAEMTQEEIDDILQSANPEADLTEHIESAAPSEGSAPRRRRRSRRNTRTTATETAATTARVPGRRRRADGGTIDIDHGEPIGTINKPTLLAGGKALAGEAGKETIVPLNRTAAAKEAFLQAKAYHEGNTFAQGGTVDSSGKKISTRMGEFIDGHVHRGADAAAKKIRGLKLEDDDAEADLKIVANNLRASGRKFNSKKKLEAAQAKIESAYERLRSIDPKSGFRKISAALIKFVAAVREEGLWDQLPAADRRLIIRIKESLAKKDYGLASIRSIPGSTTPILKSAVKKYQEAYVKAEELKDESIDKAKELWGDAKTFAHDKIDAIKQSALYTAGKKKIGEGVDSLKGMYGKMTGSFQGLLKNKHGSLVDIASEQLEIQKKILLQMQTGVVWGDKVSHVQIDDYLGKGNPAHKQKKGFLNRVGHGIKKVAWDTPLDAAGWAIRNTSDAARGFLSNKHAAVYRRPAAGQEMGADLLLISSDDFAKGVFFDPERKKRVPSVMDINKPVYDGNGKILITPQDLAQGLVDEKGHPIRSLGAFAGRTARHTVGGITGLAKDTVVGAFNTVKNNHLVSKTVGIAMSPVHAVKAVFQKWVDVYRKGQAEPLVTARDLKNGRLTFMDGSAIKDSYSINRPLMWVDTEENGEKRGNVAITWDDLDAGLVNKGGKPLNRFGNMVGSAARGALGLVGKGVGLIFKGYTGLLGLAKNIVVGGVKALISKSDPYVDVYVPNAKGEIKIGRPRLTGANIKLGRYVYLDGSTVKSAYGIDRPVLDAETGKTIISESDIERGLVDRKGSKLSKFAGKSIAGKVLSGAVGLAGWGLKTAWKGVKAVGRGLGKGAKFLTKGIFDKGADIVGYMHGAINDILGTVFQKDNVRRQDLAEIVGVRLDNIHGLLDKRLPGKTAGDTDGDGIREGSYQDFKKKRASKSASGKAKGKGGVTAAAAAAGAKEGGEEKEGSMFDGAADTKAAWDWFKKSKVGRSLGKAGSWMKGKIGGAARYLGRGAIAAGSAGLSALGGTSVGTAIGGMASSALASGAALLGSAGTALASGATAVGGTLAAGAAGAGAGIAALASNPIGWAIGAGLLAYGGYKFLHWALSDSESTKEWKALRHAYYGTDKEKHDKIIGKLESRTLKSLDKKSPGLSKEELEDFAQDFGLVSKSFLGIGGNSDEENKERMDYFTSWYTARFSPIFASYVSRVRLATRTKPGDKVDPDDIKKDRVKIAKEFFTKQATSILSQGKTKDLVPTEEGYKKYKEMVDSQKKKTEIPDGKAAAAAAVGLTPNKPEDKQPEKADEKSKGKAGEVTADAAKLSATVKNDSVSAAANAQPLTPFQSIMADPLKWLAKMGILGFAGYKVFNWIFGDSDEVSSWKALRHKFYGTSEDKHRSALKSLEKRVQAAIDGKDKELQAADLEEHAEDFGLINRGVKLGIVIGPRIGGDDNATIKARMEYFTSWYALRFRPVFQTYVGIIRAYTGSKPGDKLDPDDIAEPKRKSAIDAFRKEGDRLMAKNPKVKDLDPSLEGFIAYVNEQKRAEEVKKSKQSGNTTGGKRVLSEDAILAKVGMATASSKNKDEDSDKEDKAKKKSLADTKLQANLDASKKLAEHKAVNNRFDSGNAYATQARGTIFAATPDLNVNASALQRDVGKAGGASALLDQRNGSGGGSAPQIDPNSLKAANIPDGGSGDLGSYMKKFESGKEGSSNISWDRTGGTSYGTYQFAAKKGGLQAFLEWAGKNGGEFGKKLVAAMGAAGKLETGSSKGAAPDTWRQFAKVEGDPLGKLEQNFTYEKVYKVALAGIKNPKAKALIMGDRGLQEALWSTAVGHGIGGAPSLFMKVYKDGMSAEDWIKAIYQERPTRYQSSTQEIQASMRNRYAKELPIMLGLSKAKGQAASGADGNAQSGDGQSGGGENGGAMSSGAMATAGVGIMTGNQDQGSGGSNSDAAAGGAEGKDGWKRPTDSDIVTSPFGPRNVPGGSKNHKGIDLRAKMGDPIYAAHAGTVEAAGGSYNGVSMKHEGGLESRYLHLSKINVQPGQQVKEGQVIGQSGGTGPSGPNQYAPHLHFDLKKGGQFIDPEPFLKTAGIKLERKGEKGNESMAPQSDADAVPQTGKEQSAEQLKSQEAKAGNADVKAADPSGGTSGSTAGNDQSQGNDVAQQAASTTKASIDSKLSAAYGGGSSGSNAATGDNGSSSGGGSAPANMPSQSGSGGNVSTDNGGMPQVKTNTPAQTGQIGPDIAVNAQLEQLKLIVAQLSGLRDDCRGYFGDGSTKSGNSSSDSSEKTTPADAAKKAAKGDNPVAVTTAIEQAFAENSPVVRAIQAAVAGNNSPSTPSSQNQATPPGIDRTTIRNPIDTSKRSSSSFQS